MKKIIVIIFFLILTKGFGQHELAMINDSDGFTNVRKDKSIDSQIVIKINTGQLFYCESSSEDWWLVSFFPADDKGIGYVHKSHIKFVKDFPDNEKRRLIEVWINRMRYYLQKADTIGLIIPKRKIEIVSEFDSFKNIDPQYYMFSLFSEYFCEYGDIDLLDSYLWILILNQTSADELPHTTLDDCYQCRPELVIQRINNFPDKYHELLMNSLWSRILKNKIYNHRSEPTP